MELAIRQSKHGFHQSRGQLGRIILFMVKLGWKNSQIIDALKRVDGINAPKKSATYKWINRFRNGRKEIDDDHHFSMCGKRWCCSRPDWKGWRITTYSVQDTLISAGFAHEILMESLGLSKLSARWWLGCSAQVSNKQGQIVPRKFEQVEWRPWSF